MSLIDGEAAPDRGGAYSYLGVIHFAYQPELDHEPDPGEIVWSWVSFEEDETVGKDRPIAIVGRTPDERFAALMLSSQHHDGDNRWLPIGSGSWDDERRSSYLRTDRVLAVEAHAVRREGAIIPRPTFDSVVAHMMNRPLHP